MPDNEVLISELSTKAVNPLTMFELENTTDGEPDSGKTDASALGNFFLGQGTSPLEYADLQTDAKTPIGAINELDNEIADKAGIDDSTISADYAYSSQKIISLIPTNEASGEIASFKTQIAAPLVDCILTINAQQASGTPTPINPLPITGFTGANIPHTGANVWDEEWELGAYGNTTGKKINAPNNIRSKDVIAIKPNTSYYLKQGSNHLGTHKDYYDINGDFLSYSYTAADGVITTPDGAYFMTIWSTSGNTQYNGDASLNYPSTDTEYHAYNQNSDTISVDWADEAGTIYGGELDLLSGVLTVNKGGKIYTGANSENWFTEYDYNFYGDVVTGAKTGQTIQCSIATSSGTVYTGNLNAWISNSGRINITIPTITHTVEDFRQLLTDLNNNNTPMMIVYELATPIEYQLTPQQISAFVGVNNIWHDANGDTDVKFKQDIQNYVDEKIAEVEAMVLSLP